MQPRTTQTQGASGVPEQPACALKDALLNEGLAQMRERELCSRTARKLLFSTFRDRAIRDELAAIPRWEQYVRPGGDCRGIPDGNCLDALQRLLRLAKKIPLSFDVTQEEATFSAHTITILALCSYLGRLRIGDTPWDRANHATAQAQRQNLEQVVRTREVVRSGVSGPLLSREEADYCLALVDGARPSDKMHIRHLERIKLSGYLMTAIELERLDPPAFQSRVMAFRVLFYHLFRPGSDLQVEIAEHPPTAQFWRERRQALAGLVHRITSAQHAILDEYRGTSLVDRTIIFPWEAGDLTHLPLKLDVPLAYTASLARSGEVARASRAEHDRLSSILRNERAEVQETALRSALHSLTFPYNAIGLVGGVLQSDERPPSLRRLAARYLAEFAKRADIDSDAANRMGRLFTKVLEAEEDLDVIQNVCLGLTNLASHAKVPVEPLATRVRAVSGRLAHESEGAVQKRLSQGIYHLLCTVAELARFGKHGGAPALELFRDVLPGPAGKSAVRAFARLGRMGQPILADLTHAIAAPDLVSVGARSAVAARVGETPHAKDVVELVLQLGLPHDDVHHRRESVLVTPHLGADRRKFIEPLRRIAEHDEALPVRGAAQLALAYL